jgi:hypothetical protein
MIGRALLLLLGLFCVAYGASDTDIWADVAVDELEFAFEQPTRALAGSSATPPTPSMQLAIKYTVAPSCDPALPITPDWAGPPDPVVPCGGGISFYIVISPCPVGADSGCWDEAPDACPGRPPMPTGGCLPALPGADVGTFTTAAFSVPHDGAKRHLLASAYYATRNLTSGWWHMELDLATRVPLVSSAEPVALTPFFNPYATGSITQIPTLSVPQFGAHMHAAVYLPPSCVENRAACPAVKVVVVTDGQAAQTPTLIPKLLSRADDLVMARRARPFVCQRPAAH